MTDGELQDKIEKGFSGSSPDERAYRKVFDALRQEPSYRLSSDFAERVVSKFQPAKSYSRDVVWLYAGLGSFLVAMAIAIFLTGFQLNWGAFKFISGYPGLVIFGLLFVLVLQWMDKQFVRKPHA